MAAVPAPETWEVGGWLCRRRPGTNVGRANSASYLGPPRPGSNHFPDDVIRSFAERGHAPRFRITPLAPPGVTSLLAAAGYGTGRPVLVMTARLPREPFGPRRGPAPLTGDATSGWRSLYLSGYPEAEGRSRLELAEDAPHPRRFAEIVTRTETAGVGLGVLRDGTLGIFDVMTAPAHRRRGIASRVVESLLAWGSEAGGDLAYLQVASDNHAAVRLYERLGFTTAYEYCYASSGGAPTGSPR